MTLIDLGEIGPADETPLDPPPRRRPGRPDQRKAAFGALLAVLAGGLAGTPPQPAPEATVHVLPVTLQSIVSVVGDTLVEGAPNGLLAAYDLRTGAKLWQTAIGQSIYSADGIGDTAFYQLGPTPGFEVAEPSPQNLPRSMARGSLNAVDARTGRPRWRHPGALMGSVTPDVAVMLVPTDALPSGEIGGWQLTGVDARDGHDRWSAPLPDRTQWTFSPMRSRPDRLDASALTLVGADGAVSAIDTLTGRATPLGRIPASAKVQWSSADILAVRRPDPYAPPMPAPDPADPEPDQTPQRFEIYQLSDLDAPLWGRPISADDTVPQPCEQDVVCVWRDTGADRLDMRTGAPAGHSDTFGEFLIPGALGLWQTNRIIYGASEAVVTVAPAAARTKEGWLGVVRLRRPQPLILPLVRIPFSVDTCWNSTPQWLVCVGGAGTIALRQSEVDAMVDAARG